MRSCELPPDYSAGLTYLSPDDAETFKQRYSDREELQRRHMLIELAVAVFGASCGYIPRFEPEADRRSGERREALFTKERWCRTSAAARQAASQPRRAAGRGTRAGRDREHRDTDDDLPQEGSIGALSGKWVLVCVIGAGLLVAAIAIALYEGL